jgi:hypothetical protein
MPEARAMDELIRLDREFPNFSVSSRKCENEILPVFAIYAGLVLGAFFWFLQTIGARLTAMLSIPF